MATVDPTQYTLVPYEAYQSLNDKIQALLNGEVLFIKKFEKQQESDVLVRLEQKKFTVAQISYDIVENPADLRYWVTFNLGFNDLSLFTCFRFNDALFNLGHKFMINDIVQYTSEDGTRDSAIIEEVYQNITDPEKFAYRLSRDGGVYAEEDLVQNIYK
ncbi:hypothetical protein P59_198 [Bacillus phage P59]|nr:hypothetical protein P59_198 [Bacillus phage P59]